MGKVRQRNWLLIITGVLLLSSLLLLLTGMQTVFQKDICKYDGVTYQLYEQVPDYKGQTDCVCVGNGKIHCGEDEKTLHYNDFTSDRSLLSSSFQNFIEKTYLDTNNVVLTDINYKEGAIEIILERELLCSYTRKIPAQIGLYKNEGDVLVLSIISNIDDVWHKDNCIVENRFLIEESLISKDTSVVMYQNEQGGMINLNACFVNNRLYTPKGVFTDESKNALCTCLGPDIECESL